MIAYLQAWRELSDRARDQVPTYGEVYRRGGKLVQDTLRLVEQAQEVLRLAIVADPHNRTPWAGRRAPAPP